MSVRWVVCSFGLGLIAGVLWAPKSGRETRAAIKTSVAKGEKYIKRQSAEISDAITDTVARGRKVVRRTSKAYDRFARRTATLPKVLAGVVR
jgi:gas vesicle protein